MQGYKRFENPAPADEQKREKHISDDNRKKSTNTPNDLTPPSVLLVEGGTAINFVPQRPDEVAKRRSRHLRAWKFLRTTAAVGLLLGFSLAILESFMDIVVAHDEDADNFGVCGLGTGIWVGVLGIAAGILGVCSFRTVESNKALLRAHFALLVVASVGDGVMVIITAFCVDALPYVRTSYEWDHEGLSHYLVTRSPGIVPIDQLLYAFGALLLLIAFVHFLISTASASIMCRIYWRSEKNAPTTVIYWRHNVTENGGHPPSTMVSKAVIAQLPETPNNETVLSPVFYDNSAVVVETGHSSDH